MEFQKNSKDSIRRRLLIQRESLTAVEVIQKSQKIQESVLKVFSDFLRVGLYASFKNEVRTQELFEGWIKSRKQIFFPRVVGKKIEFVQVEDKKDLIVGYLDILEPQGDRVIEVQNLDLVIVPGVAFDGERIRLGFGKGYYDRCLEGYQGTKVGLCYEFQVVRSLNQVPHEKHDMQCHHVVTEKRIF